MNGKMISFNANGSGGRGYLAVSNTGNGPGVVVLQEWWGLVDHIKTIADRFAAEGFTALAPDLYEGQATTKPDQAGKLMMALNIDKTEKQLRGAIEHLLSLDETTGHRVGTVGFCMGGQLSLYAACANNQVGACVDFYGIHPNVKPNFAKLQAPVLGFFGEKDSFVNPNSVHLLESQLKDAGKSVDFTIFKGADHAFFNDSRPEVYHEAHAKTAWRSMVAFFRKNL